VTKIRLIAQEKLFLFAMMGSRFSNTTVQNDALNKSNPSQFIIHIPSSVTLGNFQLAAHYKILNKWLLGTHLVNQKIHYPNSATDIQQQG
jgi:hypothetical protein